MVRKSIIDEITSKYVDNYLENSKRINYTDLTAKDKLVTVLYKDLPKTEVNGYPVASDYVDKKGRAYSSISYNKLSAEEKKNCELRFYYLPYSHELYVGTTGSGKTTGCVEPQLRAISSQKNKPNLFLTDPKGEIFERNARHLHEQGYKIFVLNFKDIECSDRWNPLWEIYDKKMSLSSIRKGAIMRTGKVDDALIPRAPADAFDGKTYIEYDGFAFPNGEAFESHIAFKTDIINADIDYLVNAFSGNVMKPQSEKEKSWEYGAKDLLSGIVTCMLEDAENPESGFTRDMMTLRTIQHYYLALKNFVLGPSEARLDSHPLLANKSAKALSLMATALNNAPNTMRSYCGVFDTASQDWFKGNILALTTGNTIDLDNLGDQPFAVFIITRDYEKSDFTVAGMFIDWVYRRVLEKAENSPRNKDGTPSTRPIHFILDEFGNIPEIRDFENKIATARSRNIWFHLVVQSYEQLSIVYDSFGAKKSEVICDNCNAQIFLGAQSRVTKERFSHECGTMWVPSLNSTFTPNDMSMDSVAVLPISELDLISEGKIYVKRLYTPVITSQFIRSYVCAANGDFKHFYDARAYYDFAPIISEPFTSPKYTYDRLFMRFKQKNKWDF